MKSLISLLVVCLGAGCSTPKDPTPKTVNMVPGTGVSGKRLAAVCTPEVVKGYPVGRYTDPNFPDEMHEQHTVYRKEQSPDWNYLPDPPPVLPTGTPSNYADVSGQWNAKQRAYAEALQEQNRAMQKRIEQLRQEAGKVPGLQQELEQLKQKGGQPYQSQPTPEPVPTPAKVEDGDVLSCVDPQLPTWEEGVSDPGEIAADSDDQSFLFSQMRLNDVFATELAAAERQKISAVLSGPFFRRREFVLFNQ